MKSIFINLCALLCVFGIVACEDDESKKGVEYDPNKPVVLSSFYPDSGKIADKIILDGDNFGSEPNKIKVYFNNKKSTVIGTTGKRMYAIVPKTPGDTCTVSVVIGNDSAVYGNTFRYKISVSVSTIVGNGSGTFSNGGTLSTTTLKPRFLCVDKENNLFVTLNEGSTFGLLKINEEENSVVTLALGNSGNVLNPQTPCADMTTGIITSSDDNVHAQYYTCDPQEGWAMRRRLWKWKEGSVGLPSHTWKKAIAACELDGCLYMHQRDGQLLKVDPKTREAEIIFKVTQEGDSYGLAFHPLKPNMLYFSFSSNAGVNANTICSMDINDPEGTFKHLNNSTTPGHRDGELATAQFNNPFQIYFDPEGYLYIADCNNHCIRRITPEDIVETVLGIPGTSGWQDGDKEEALFKEPTGLGVSSEGVIYVAEWGNNRIRKLAVE